MACYSIVLRLKYRNILLKNLCRKCSLRSRRKQGGERGARTLEKMGDWGLGTRERLLQRPHFFISAAASGRKILIG